VRLIELAGVEKVHPIVRFLPMLAVFENANEGPKCSPSRSTVWSAMTPPSVPA